MTSNDVPGRSLSRELERFLTESIDSVEQCEMLVAMRNHPERWWTAREMTVELFLAPAPTALDLEVLATRGLLEVRIANDVHYRYSPVSRDVARVVSDLAEAYRTRRVDVLSFIVGRKGRALKHFAEAFTFRRDS